MTQRTAYYLGLRLLGSGNSFVDAGPRLPPEGTSVSLQVVWSSRESLVAGAFSRRGANSESLSLQEDGTFEP